MEHIVIENIKRIRKEKHITQEQLAEYCETSVSYIGILETYKNIPKLSTIERIAKAMNVPVFELFEENKAADNMDSSGKTKTDVAQEEGKQKIREHLKNEILTRMSSDLDNILLLI